MSCGVIHVQSDKSQDPFNTTVTDDHPQLGGYTSTQDISLSNGTNILDLDIKLVRTYVDGRESYVTCGLNHDLVLAVTYIIVYHNKLYLFINIYSCMMFYKIL